MSVHRYREGRGRWGRRAPAYLLCLLTGAALLLLGGCAADPIAVNEMLQSMPGALQQAAPPGVEFIEQRAAATATLPATEAPADEEEGEEPPAIVAVEEGEDASAQSTREPATVTVRNRSVNIRVGPGLEYGVVAGARQGATFATLGRTEDGWWRICCIAGANDEADAPTESAWISDRVVSADDAAQELPLLQPLFPDDLEAQWSVVYECGSDRCAVTQCAGRVEAEVRSADDPRFLEINRTVTWDDACGENSTWLHQIDRLEGVERYGNSTGLFLFDYWIGVDPGPVNGLFALSEDQQIRIWCSDIQEAELEEAEGWTTLYEGKTCHDVRTGMLVSMEYTKRWLFSGEYEGEMYERAYFGDFEVYQVRLEESNVEMAALAANDGGNGESPADEEQGE